MIRHAKDMPVVRIPNMLGGKRYVDGQRFLEADESMGAGAFFGRATMPPGGSFGFHIQKCRPAGDMELYYIISGRALAYEEDKEQKLLDNPRLLRTPIVRNGRLATVGFCPEIWKGWT